MKKMIRNKPILVMIVLFCLSMNLSSRGGGYIGQSIFKMMTGLILVGFLYIIVGKELFSWSKKSARLTFLWGCVPLLLNTYDTIFKVVETYKNPFRRLHDDWWVNAIIILVYTLSIGFWEEGLFRGIITNGLVKLLPKTKRGIFVAIALNGLIFGLLHMDWQVFSMGYDMQTGILHNVLLVLKTGSIGMVLAAIYLRTKNIWPCMLAHAMIDFASYMEGPLTSGVIASSYSDKVYSGGFWNIGMKLSVFLIVANICIAIFNASKINLEECVMWKTEEKVKEEVLEAVE